MIISLVGLVIYSLLFTFVVFNEPASYVEIIIVASFFMGATGTYTTFMMGAFSYVADTTDTVSRTRAFSVAESCLYIGKIVGPLVSGVWAQSFGFHVPFATATICAGLCIVYIIFFVEESLFLMKERQTSLATSHHTDPLKNESSLQNEDKRESQYKGQLVVNPLQTYDNLKILFHHKMASGEQSPVPFIAVAFFFFHTSLMGYMQVVYVYMKHEYDWSSLMIGLYDSISGIIQVLFLQFGRLAPCCTCLFITCCFCRLAPCSLLLH